MYPMTWPVTSARPHLVNRCVDARIGLTGVAQHGAQRAHHAVLLRAVRLYLLELAQQGRAAPQGRTRPEAYTRSLQSST